MFRNFRRNHLAIAIALSLTAPPALSGTVFYEPFNVPDPGCNSGNAGSYPFPAGWLLRNVDNQVPNAQVAYVNDAWEVREDFITMNLAECAAFSTSYYSPAGQADDWMWTPPITLPAGSSVLSWRALAPDASYPDGYEVRVMVSPDTPTGGTGSIGNQVSASSQIFSTAAEASSWTPHSVSLASYAGQQVYVGFRNHSVDKFLLLIDDVKVINDAPDAVAQTQVGYAGEYSRAPEGLAAPISLPFAAYNGGGSTLSNVYGEATFRLDANAVGSTLQSSTIASLDISSSAALEFAGPHSVSGNGAWTVSFLLHSDQDATDSDLANNAAELPGPVVGGSELARDEGDAVGVLGIGAGNGGEIGVQFTLGQDTPATGIRFGMGAQPETVDDGNGGMMPNPFIGSQLVANLRSFDTGAGEPGALIDSTVAVAATAAGGLYDVAFVNGARVLAAGTYVLTVSEPPEGTMSLPQHLARFTPGTAWVIWPTSPFGGWANVEDFGPGFARTPRIALLTELSVFKDGFEDGAPMAGLPRPGVGFEALRTATHTPAYPKRRPAPTRLVSPH